MSFVSVIIPSYNYASWLPVAIESCLSQQGLLKEIIIVDDHSKDNSLPIARNYQQQYPLLIKVFINPGKGGNDSRNYGFEQSAGAFIQWLDADDLLMPGKLEAQTAFLLQHPEIDIVYSDWQLDTYHEDGTVERTEIKKARQYEDYLLELLNDNWQPPHSYLLTRRMAQKLHEIKAWNPGTRAAQDREYFTRAAILGAKFAYVQGTWVIYNRRKLKSVSRALSLKEKSKIIIDLLLSFMQEINCQDHIADSDKLYYNKVIYTQLACLASYYRLPVGNKKLTFANVDWSLLQGMKPRLRIIRNLVKELYSSN